MKLKINPKKAYLQIDECIKSGYELRDYIVSQHGTEMSQKILDEMNLRASEWITSTQGTLLIIFPTASQSDAFIRITPSPLGRSGWNIKHNALLNRTEAQIEKLQEYQRIVNTYISKPLEKPWVVVVISVGSGIAGTVIGSLLTMFLVR